MLFMQAEVSNEYLVYDINSFLADAGGYMGLLLGESLFSLILFIMEGVKMCYKKNILKKPRICCK